MTNLSDPNLSEPKRAETARLEPELRGAIDMIAARVPADVYDRLGSHPYRRRHRGVRRAATVAAPVAAMMAAVAVLVTGFGPGAQVAFAGWSATPTAPAPGQVSSAEATCLAEARSGLQSQASTPLQREDLGTPEGTYETDVVDTRGPYTLVVMRVAGTLGTEDAACLTGLGEHPQLESSTRSTATPVPSPDAIGTTGFGQSGTAAAGHTILLGAVGATVRAVTVALASGTSVTATVENGMYAAWWPGSARPLSAEAHAVTGSTTEHVFTYGTSGSKAKVTWIAGTAT